MDLRRRLVRYLGTLLLGLLAISMLVTLQSLRGEIAAEVKASQQLALTLLDIGRLGAEQPPAPATARLQALLARGPLRHVSVRLDDAAPPPARASKAAQLAVALGLAGDIGQGQLVQLGTQRLRIAPNPLSEIDERLADTVRLWSTLLFFSVASMLAAWWAAERALAPVRALEAGLRRLASGEADPAMPPFALREFARVAGAIEQLAAALAEARAAQQRLAHRLIDVQETERQALAMELHDDMGQSLTAIKVTAAYLERHAGRIDAAGIADCAGHLRRDARAASVRLRAMLDRLRPHGLDGASLPLALDELVDGWRQRAAAIDFRLTLPVDWPQLEATAAVALYRIVQEALTNVVRHSGARHCSVRIEIAAAAAVRLPAAAQSAWSRTALPQSALGQSALPQPALGQLSLHIDDDGCGLPSARGGDGCGLLGMAERARMAGGCLLIGPATPGLSLCVRLPLAAGGAGPAAIPFTAHPVAVAVADRLAENAGVDADVVDDVVDGSDAVDVDDAIDPAETGHAADAVNVAATATATATAAATAAAAAAATPAMFNAAAA